MARKCFISFKTEDVDYKNAIQNDLDVDMIDKSLNEAIDSDDEEYIMQQIRENYLADSTVTIHLIGAHSAENLGSEEQKFIKRELQASLYNGENNPRSGILGVVLPSAQSQIYKNGILCKCGNVISVVNMEDDTTIKEFHRNFLIKPNSNCHWTEDDRYCVLVTWEDFVKDPEKYIELAFSKREHPIAEKVTVRP
ncbi:MAG TPA: TIR domain-containing protein [Candidatus Paceibacterota bacterium]